MISSTISHALSSNLTALLGELNDLDNDDIGNFLNTSFWENNRVERSGTRERDRGELLSLIVQRIDNVPFLPYHTIPPPSPLSFFLLYSTWISRKN